MQHATLNANHTIKEDISRLVECMALNSTTSSEGEGSQVSEIDSFLIEGVSGSGSESGEPEYLLSQAEEPEYLLPRTPPPEDTVDPDTQVARLEALLEAAGISKLAEGKQLADPERLKRITSSVSCALDQAAAELTRMRTVPGQADPTSLVAACSQGDISRVRRLLDEGRLKFDENSEEGESLLSLACSAGYYELAQVLLAMRANVEDRGVKGDCTPLMEAASAGHTDIVRLLIAHGADVNAQSSSGNTPLMYACAGGHEEVVRVLLEAGANVEDHNENGHTPLMEAASAGHVPVAKILLEFGAGINTHSNEFKESALTLACYKGHLEMVRFLLDAGADQEHKTDEMHTALMEASMDGHVDVARLLLDSGAQVNMPADSFESPLTLAACGGHTELALLLLERGANIEEVNDEGYTPLMEASREGHEEMVVLLLTQGADMNAQTEETQETALTLACCGGFAEVADLLIKADADLELGASTPLMEASQEGHLDLVKFLLEAKAQVNATTGTGDTALTYACENGHTDVADVLLQYGAQLEHESEGGRTPLMKAARAGHLCTVQFLISRGADVSRQTSNNDHTPLSLACAGGHLNVVEVLLQQGADPFHKLKDNSTMLIEAAKGGHTTVVQMLIDYPNSLVSSSALDTSLDAPSSVGGDLERVPPPGSEALPPPTKVSNLRINGRKGATTATTVPAPAPAPTPAVATPLALSASVKGALSGSEVAGYDMLDGTAGYLLEDLERKGLDAKSYIQTMLRRTEGSSKEEQIIQKEQILAELQRVEKELQEKAQAQLLLSHEPRNANKREAGEGSGLTRSVEPAEEREGGEGAEEIQPPASFSLPYDQATTTTEVIQNMSNQQLNRCSLATLPPSERPKAKASRKIDGKGGKKSQLQAALQQHSQQLAQLQQLQQLNQQLQQQVIQQRQLKQQNQQTLAALQQNAIANQQQLAALQQNVAQLQQLEQTILAQQTTAHQQQHQQLQQRVQQIMQQKQQLQHQIKQFQQQVEQQLAFTQHTAPVPTLGAGGPPPLPSGPPPPPPGSKKRGGGEGGTEDGGVELVSSADLNYIINTEQFITTGGVPAGIDPSLLTSAAFELVQASQALQAVQAVPPILHADSPPMMTPLTQDPRLLSEMDPAQIAAAVQHCPIPLDSPLTYSSVMYSGPESSLASGGVNNGTVVNSGTVTTQIIGGGHAQPISGFGQELFLPPNLSCAFGQGQVDPGLAGGGAAQDKKKAGGGGKKKAAAAGATVAGAGAHQGTPPLDPNYPAVAAAAAAVPGGGGGQFAAAGAYPPSAAAYPAGYPPPATAGVPVVDLDSETDSNHDTALTLACAGGHEELVTLLLSRGADNEHRDKKGFTPLILAATAGHDKVVEILLNHGADIEAQSERTKDTPLSLACSGGRYEVVEILLSRGANKEHRNVSDYTPLSLAASGGYTNIIKLLLAHGAEINSRTGSKLGISPLMLAAMNGHTAAVKLLLDMGSDINAQIETNRNTALTLACFQGRHEVVSLLLDRKANVEHRAKTGLTPLMEAASGGYTEVGRVLLDKGADVNAAPVPSSRDTALTIAADKGHYRFVELLLSRGAQVDVRNKKGNSSLWLAANGGHLDVVQLLYSAGADIDSQDNRKVSCLMAAFRKGHSKVVKWLVKHVTQFPSDTELTRFIATINDKDLLKKTHQCLEIIRVAKDRQASEANKAANILLEELEQEKTREENKKAAAARKRDKKKRKKAAKKGPVDDDEEEEKDEATAAAVAAKESNAAGENEDDDEKEKTPEIVLEEVNSDILNRDSGIDANSQGSSGASVTDKDNNNEKLSAGKKKKKNKKSKEREKNEKNEADSAAAAVAAENNNKKSASEEKENINITVAASTTSTINTAAASNSIGMRAESKEKSPGEEEERPDSRNERNSQPRVPCIEGYAAPEPQLEFKEAAFFEPVRKGRRAAARQTEDMSGDKMQLVGAGGGKKNAAGGTGNAAAGGKSAGATPDAGWKEVVRKSKKVSVPSNAISRVIGRGGSNINAIRELSGAHIEVEKQSKGQGDRTILIKGSADATRLANTWISSIISNPEKDLQEIVGKAQYKQLSQAWAKANSAVAVTKTVVKTTVVTATTVTRAGGVKGAAEVKKQTTIAAITTATKVTLAYSTPVMTPAGGAGIAAATAKSKPVTSSSFAEIAAGKDGIGMIHTGPQPATSGPAAALKQAAVVSKQQQVGGKAVKKEELLSASVIGGGIAAAPGVGSQLPTDPKDFSPFKTFNNLSQGFGWNSASADNGPKGFATNSNGQIQSSGLTASQPDVSKAPGYRSGGVGGTSSPSLIGAAEAGGNWSGSSGQLAQAVTSAGGAGQTVTAFGRTIGSGASDQQQSSGGSSNNNNPGQLYPTQERCNSAPGTPVSPLGGSGGGSGPSPIAPPVTGGVLNKQQPTVGSDSPVPAVSDTATWFRPPGAIGGGGMRSITPDGDLDRRDRWGGGIDDADVPRAGSYHNSPAKAPGAPLPDLFGRTNLNKPVVEPLPGLTAENLLNAAAQLSSVSNNYDSLIGGGQSQVPGANVSMAPGIPMPDMAFSRMGPVMSRFTAPPTMSNTTTFSAPLPPLSSAALKHQQQQPTGLNPNAPDFAQGGLYNTGGLRHNMPPRVGGGGQLMNGPSKMSNAFTGFGNQFGAPGAPSVTGGGINNFQNILTNQGINAYLSQMSGAAHFGGGGGTGGPPPPVPSHMPTALDLVNSGLADLNLSGKTLSELTDILGGPESPFPSNPLPPDEPKFSRPIGAERRTGGPSPIGMGVAPGGGGVRKPDPYTVWELPPSYTDNLHHSGGHHHNNDAFSGLIPSLSGQTLSSLDNLSKNGFVGDIAAASGGGGSQFNSGVAAVAGKIGGGGGDPGTIGGGGHTPSSAGFGMSPANLTPSKADQYADWGTGSTSSAPGSANKNQGGFIERGDPATVRRNINQNAMWPKNWEE